MLDSAASRAGLAAAIGSSFAFGINTVGAKIAADAGATGPLIVLYRVVVMLALIVLAVGAMRWTVALPRRAWPAMAVMAATSAGMSIGYMSSVAFIPVTVAAVMFYTYPVFIVLAGPLATGRPLQPRELAVACLAFAGIVLVVGPSFHALDPRGLALALGAAVFTAAQFYAANRLAEESVVGKLFWVQVGVLPVAALLVFFSAGAPASQALAGAPAAVVATIVCYVLGSICMIVALSRLSASIAGLIFCMEPVISALASAVWLGERLTMVQYAGGLLVIAAVLATAAGPARQPQAA